MFENLSKRLTESLDKLRRKGALSEADVDAALREVRVALLEADVALPVVKDFTASLRGRIVGAAIVASVNPAQMVIKLVHDELVRLLGGEAVEAAPAAPFNLSLEGRGRREAPGEGESAEDKIQRRITPTLALPPQEGGNMQVPFASPELPLNVPPPAVVLMCGLQGSGKTTSTGKLAKRLADKQRKKVLVASLDVYRPAAQEQLATVARTAGVESLPVVPGEMPEAITMRALDAARKGGYDVLLLDTAGRLHVDDALMEELEKVKALSKPAATLLVADALTGQDAVNVARAFNERIGVTGIVLTRLDGDARGGAALSMRAVTGAPILYAGTGEGIDALEPFDAARIAGRILDKGDVVSLVEAAAQAVSAQDAEAMAARMQRGQFDLTDMLQQMRSIGKMGGIGSLLGMLPGAGKMKEAMAGQTIDERLVKRQEAIILAMTPAERAKPQLLNASRRRRIAGGSGTQVQDVNRLIKQFQQMETMMKQMRKLGMKGMMNPAALKQMLGGF
ncbi:MAG: signal recognition particle protein [Alphaproteobacteria bacterium]